MTERFNSKFEKRGSDECWPWTAGLAPNGYGKFWLNGKTLGAHRISYLIHCGPIPEDKVICHKCDNKKCVNPSHLFLGSMKDNIQDCVKKKRQWNQKKTHCPQGHEYNKENTYVRTDGKGKRHCLVCQRIRDSKRTLENRLRMRAKRRTPPEKFRV